MEESSSVNYTTKELIGRLDSKMDQILDAVSNKASTAALDRLDGKIGDLAKRVVQLESDLASGKAVSTNTRWLILTAIPGAAGLAQLFSRVHF